MTINSEIRKVGPFIGNGTASAFPFTFKVFQASDLEVVRLEVSTNVETVLTLNSQYTVTLNADQDSNPGGTVNLIGGALGSGYTLTLTSDVPYLQPTDLTNQGGFYPDVINDSLDRATIQIQQQGVDVNRSIKIPVSASGVNVELPAPQPDDLIGWDSAGKKIINVDPASIATFATYSTAYADVFEGNGVTQDFVLSHNPAVLYNLDVSIQGATQEPTRDYTLAGTTISFTTAPPNNTRILVKYKQSLPLSSSDSQDVRYLPPFSNSVATNVEAKLAQTVSVKDFGAVGDGVTDDTTAFTNAVSSGKSLFIPKGTYKISSPVTFGQNVTGEGRDEGQTLISLTGSGKLVVGDWWGVWSNFTVTHDTDNAIMIDNQGGSHWVFENFRIEAGAGNTNQIGINFDITSASIYSNHLDNFKIKTHYPIRIYGNGTEGFNANTIGKSTACYFQNFASAISIIDSLYCDANTFSGYFETGTNIFNYQSSLSTQPFRQNRINIINDAVTRVLNTSSTYAITDKNLWTILDGGFTLSGKYPQNQDFIGPAKTEIRAVNTTAISMNTATPTTLSFDSKQFDTLSEFSEGAGEFQPKYAGYYLINAGFITDAVAWTTGQRFEIQIYKNGSAYATGDWNVIDANATVALSSQVSSMVYMNGTTDTILLKGLHNQGGTISTGTDSLSNYINITRIG